MSIETFTEGLQEEAPGNDKKQYIRIRGANEDNLKNVSLDIPRNKFVVFTGL